VFGPGGVGKEGMHGKHTIELPLRAEPTKVRSKAMEVPHVLELACCAGGLHVACKRALGRHLHGVAGLQQSEQVHSSSLLHTHHPCMHHL
jgi:hypothetical protein